MINARAVEKIERHVQDALARGAKLLAGGCRVRDAIADGPNYYAPTVLGDVDPGAQLCGEETFGPVVSLFSFRGEEDAVRRANDTPHGLAAYFYSRDVARIWRVAGRLECGVIGVNEGAISAEAAPFGGIKDSGYGREGSRRGLDDYLQSKYLCQGGLV
jgi:succinate-semialdehyde dehydrogenase/glutarate-semialdehyde dehydrogenase